MPLRIAYFGLPLGALLLDRDGHELSFCTVPPLDAPGLRRLKRRFEGRVLEAFELGDALEDEVAMRLAEEPPDILVSWFWTRKLPLEWLRVPRLGAIGVHPSLLPRHRGPNPYFWAIDGGDVETGVSVHRLEAEYDTGAILEQERIVIGERNAWQLARALDRPSLRCLRRTVAAATRGLPVGIEQTPELATLAPEPQGELLRADFKWPTERILRRIRALSPVPGLALSIADVAFFVTRAHPSAEFTRALLPGEAEIARGRLVIRTGDAAIAVETGVLVGEDDDSEEVSGAELAEHMAQAISLARGTSLKGDGG
ncbi:MAG TPA: formyltransferase family protein [Polyangiaceae bacterium]|nr:formyltransferase family protein [Polyangiaceae bacterium]